MNKHRLVCGSLVVATLLAILLLSGCGKSGVSVPASDSQLFSSPPLKDDWAAVTAALQTNGFVVAITNLDKMRSENPSPDQLAAINATIRTLNQHMTDLAAKGDANARAAFEQLRTVAAPHR